MADRLISKDRKIIKDEQNEVKKNNTKTQVIDQFVSKVKELKEEAKNLTDEFVSEKVVV